MKENNNRNYRESFRRQTDERFGVEFGGFVVEITYPNSAGF
ncbi:hypothetical protein XBP1_300004 [Xenorhabdus bovienii str. puntauvense]|uniref:Uncharacterized protein n=1 Tax=Xenorhabdus bovienii str. puntauvense TaxID=1398201 RepID=A0A077NKB6_XENBV|nr:hypothetical protein XBP1_300004 [Xenorhabdus bovienii str. puntauvense]